MMKEVQMSPGLGAEAVGWAGLAILRIRIEAATPCLGYGDAGDSAKRYTSTGS
jgi:hypothetical protein